MVGLTADDKNCEGTYQSLPYWILVDASSCYIWLFIRICCSWAFKLSEIGLFVPRIHAKTWKWQSLSRLQIHEVSARYQAKWSVFGWTGLRSCNQASSYAVPQDCRCSHDRKWNVWTPESPVNYVCTSVFSIGVYSDKMQSFTDQSLVTSEQHKEATASRVKGSRKPWENCRKTSRIFSFLRRGIFTQHNYRCQCQRGPERP